jgi:hypothetical protein
VLLALWMGPLLVLFALLYFLLFPDLGAKWAQIKRYQVSKGSRINVNFADLWSGRWESNPTPIAWKLLNVLRFFSRLWNTLEHNRGYFLDGLAVSISQNVGIDPKSDAGICVP